MAGLSTNDERGVGLRREQETVSAREATTGAGVQICSSPVSIALSQRVDPLEPTVQSVQRWLPRWARSGPISYSSRCTFFFQGTTSTSRVISPTQLSNCQPRRFPGSSPTSPLLHRRRPWHHRRQRYSEVEGGRSTQLEKKDCKQGRPVKRTGSRITDTQLSGDEYFDTGRFLFSSLCRQKQQRSSSDPMTVTPEGDPGESNPELGALAPKVSSRDLERPSLLPRDSLCFRSYRGGLKYGGWHKEKKKKKVVLSLKINRKITGIEIQ
ncbi:hypothetical protein BJX63DRAFT_101633 [Aspergillus granulosus]|uniref:Uncharacterized protein n=1 Tax=Aspergillus granulosus TaxID=176169 RepID=A0ABR4GUG9_9EURO